MWWSQRVLGRWGELCKVDEVEVYGGTQGWGRSVTFSITAPLMLAKVW